MKNILKSTFLAAAAGMIAFSAIAQKKNDVPQAVLTAFSTKYPQAQVKKWKPSGDTYLARFTNDNKKYQASYSKTGEWISTEREIDRPSGLPTELQSFLKTSTYASWHIDDMKRVRTPMQNMYVIKLDNHSGSPFDYEDMGSAENKSLSFNDNGKLIKVVSL
ncbi:MAG TPA: PepSY-like domain-containing protein [Mucilaginibacter sp.]|jgi:hypothetical protein|nr:PepSY-like domain-containing protein [Mucilaginibacter sp.]